jgi:hypothetical protein
VKLHIAGDVASTPGSSAGYLHLEVPSAALHDLLDIVRISKMTTFEVKFEF